MSFNQPQEWTMEMTETDLLARDLQSCLTKVGKLCGLQLSFLVPPVPALTEHHEIIDSKKKYQLQSPNQIHDQLDIRVIHYRQEYYKLSKLKLKHLFALSSCTEKTKITGMNETVLRSAKQ
jgi:hypothetical protein